MYGQKQILQCLAVALILAVFNFHRSVIKRNKAIVKPKIRLKDDYRAKIKEFDNIAFNQSLIIGYCMRYPFGKNEYVWYESIVFCPHICFDTFGTWLHKQCRANCCINKTNALTLRTRTISRKLNVKQLQKTRNEYENALESSNVDNGASLSSKQCEEAITIIEPLNNEILMSDKSSNMYECKIQILDEFICKNITSDIVDIVKLETNKTEKIMDYHEFLFNTGTTETKNPVAHHYVFERKKLKFEEKKNRKFC